MQVEKRVDPNYHYAIVIDCGSSGTRANLFRWDSALKFPELLNNIEPLKNSNTKKPITFKIKGGLSKLNGLAEDTARYFTDAPKGEKFGMLGFIEANLNEEQRQNTGVFILATAGMRLISETLRNNIIMQTTKLFKNKYDFATVQTAVISGADEGMYTWLTTNSRLKLFKEEDGKKGISTAGIIEMGGASLQVAYRVTKSVKDDIQEDLGVSEAQTVFPELIVRPNVGRSKEPHELISVSFLGIGGNSARDAYYDMLISKRFRSSNNRDPGIMDRFISMIDGSEKSKKRKMGSTPDDNYRSSNSLNDDTSYTLSRALQINDPCLPRDEKPVIVKKPKSMLTSTGKTIGFPTISCKENCSVDETNIFNVHIHGTSNFKECMKNVESLLWTMKNERFNCKKVEEEPCPMALLGTPFIPFKDMEFLGVGDLKHTTHYLDSSEGFFDQPRILAKINEMCDMTYRQILSRYKGIEDNDPERAKTECFKGAWVYNLMVKGFLLDQDNSNFRTVEKIDGYALEWPLGAALEKSLIIEMGIASRPPPKSE